MIPLESFILLSLSERLNYVFNHGTELFAKQKPPHLIKLYMLDDLYVEIWFMIEKNKIEKVVALNVEEVLIKYGDLIDVSELFT